MPGWLPAAMTWLTSALDGHWNGEYYQSVLPVPTDYRAPYDPNIDIVQSAIYGAESVTDPRLLATAAQLRAQWADPALDVLLPGQRRRRRPRHSARCSAATRATSTTATPTR